MRSYHYHYSVEELGPLVHESHQSMSSLVQYDIDPMSCPECCRDSKGSILYCPALQSTKPAALAEIQYDCDELVRLRSTTGQMFEYYLQLI